MGQSEAGLARALMRQGRSDEEIQALTGLSLLALVELRIELAMAPGLYGPAFGPPPPPPETPAPAGRRPAGP